MCTFCVIGSAATFKGCMVMRVIGKLSLCSQLLRVESHTTWVRCIAGKDLLKHIIVEERPVLEVLRIKVVAPRVCVAAPICDIR